MDGYTPKNKTPDIKDPKFLDWAKEKLIGAGEYVDGLHQNIQDSETIINGVNHLLYKMCRGCSLVEFKPFTLRESCLQVDNWFWGRYRWYPALLHVQEKRGVKELPNGHLILGVAVYDVIGIFKKKERATESFARSDFLLCYKNMKHSPEIIEAYEKCVKTIPNLITAYEEYVIETMK